MHRKIHAECDDGVSFYVITDRHHELLLAVEKSRRFSPCIFLGEAKLFVEYYVGLRDRHNKDNVRKGNKQRTYQHEV